MALEDETLELENAILQVGSSSFTVLTIVRHASSGQVVGYHLAVAVAVQVGDVKAPIPENHILRKFQRKDLMELYKSPGVIQEIPSSRNPDFVCEDIRVRSQDMDIYMHVNQAQHLAIVLDSLDAVLYQDDDKSSKRRDIRSRIFKGPIQSAHSTRWASVQIAYDGQLTFV